MALVIIRYLWGGNSLTFAQSIQLNVWHSGESDQLIIGGYPNYS